MVDLSGTRDGVLTFDFAYGEYGIKNKTFTATVEASTDGGKTWNAIWNFQDSYTGQQASNYIISGSAEVPVPAEYNVDGVQFAFRYVHPNEDTTGQLAIDNVKLMAVEDGPVAQKYTITATAGEGGSITPAGAVSVKEGASQTFAIAAQEGYAIADVLVDGQSVGAVDSYTFENVTANHTIAAVFTKTASDVQFDNDFESETFPGHGWTLQSTRSDSPYTWYQGTNTKLNSTKQARIDMDYYEDPWGGGWSVGGIRKPLLPMAGGSDKLQDEYLISPVVNLTGKTPTLNFDYLLFKSVIGNYCSVTVEATTDGSQTWTTIWTAADLEPVSGYWFMGTANVAVPAAFCTDNAQFAFHFYKKANRGYDDTDAMFAIDNVTMTYGTTDPCADGSYPHRRGGGPRHLHRDRRQGPLGVLRLQQAVQRRRRQERDHPGGPDHRRAGPRLGRARVDLDRLRRRRGLLRLRPGCRPCEGPARQHHQRGHHPARMLHRGRPDLYRHRDPGRQELYRHPHRDPALPGSQDPAGGC